MRWEIRMLHVIPWWIASQIHFHKDTIICKALVTCLDHEDVASDTLRKQARLLLGCAMRQKLHVMSSDVIVYKRREHHVHQPLRVVYMHPMASI